MAWSNRGPHRDDTDEDPDALNLAKAFEKGVRKNERDPFHPPIKASGSCEDFMHCIGKYGSYDDNDGWAKERARIKQLELDWKKELKRRKRSDTCRRKA